MGIMFIKFSKNKALHQCENSFSEDCGSYSQLNLNCLPSSDYQIIQLYRSEI